MNVLKQIGALFIAAFVMVTDISAQNVKFESGNFPGRENDLRNALLLIDQGEKFLFDAESELSGKGVDIRYKAKAVDMVSKGLEYFLQANAFNSESAQLNYTIGKSYLYVGNYVQALSFLKKAILLDEKGFKDIYFLIGQACQQMGEFELAIESYNLAVRSYDSETNWSNAVNAGIRECKYAQELMNDAVDVRVENIGTAMNTASMEYFPIVTEGDELLFFERFSAGKNKLYAAERTPEGWKAAVETNQSFLLLPEKNKEVLKELTLVDKSGTPAITRWFTVNGGNQQLFNQDYYESMAASANSQGKTIAYFSSNRYEAGGFDIFMSQINKKGQWEQPRGVSEINTEGDEYSVVLHPAGHTLYFSSNGHQTMGGYDIFKSEYDGKHWGKPENLGYPINSTADDIVYAISEDGNRLYFSSNRTDGKGGYDIYLVNFMPDVMPVRQSQSTPVNVSAEAIGIISADEPLKRSEAPASLVAAPSVVTKYPAAVHGFISDNQTYMPLSNVTLRLLDRSNNAEEVIETDNKGTFYTTLSAGGSYRIVINVPGYQVYVEDFKISEEVGQKLSKNIGLISLAGESRDADVTLAEALPEQAEAVAESEEDYEDIVVLSPILDHAQSQEYPVAITGLVTDNVTFAPIQEAMIKVTLKGTDDVHVFESDGKGFVSFPLASGNTYVVMVKAENYEDYVEELVLSKESGQKLSKTIQLRSISSAAVKEGVAPPSLVSLLQDETLTKEESVFATPVVELVPVPVLVEEPEPVVLTEPVVVPEPEPVVLTEPVVVPEPEPVVLTEPVVVPEPEPVVELVAEEPEVQPWQFEEVVAEEIPAQEPVQDEHISYEDNVVVLAPMIALTEGTDSIVENREYPAGLKIYVSDSQTLQPLAVSVKLTVKNTDVDNMLQTDGKGMLDVTVASGNAYRLTVEHEGYAPVVEDFDVAKGPEQTLTRNILLSSLTPVVTPEKIVAEVYPIEEEQPVVVEVAPEPEPVVFTEPVVEPEPEPVVFTEPVVEPEPEPVVFTEPVVVPEPEPVIEFVAEEPEVQPWQFEEVAAEEIPAQEPVQEELISYEDNVVVLAPMIALTEGTDSIVENREYPAGLKIYVSDSQTLQPLAVSVKLTVKNTDMDNMLQTDGKGMLDVTVASGNAYRLTVEHEGYAPVVEDFDVAKGPEQTLTRNILLSSLPPVITPEKIVAEVHPIEEQQPVVTEDHIVAPEPEVIPEPVIEEPVVVEVAPVAPAVKVAEKTHQPAKVEERPAVIALSGTVVNADTRKPIAITEVVLTDATRGFTEVIKVSDGKFNVNTLAGSNYSVKVTAKGYQTEVQDIATSSNDKTINVPVKLRPVTETFVVTVYFDFDRAALNEKAEQTLEEVIALLKQGKEVYLIGYTDNAGGYGYNKRLSERRVETVDTYLRVHGIAPSTTSWKGLFNPVETNFTISGRQLNNRVEIWMK